jgi:peptide/nickel transport system permease protein
MLYYILRRILYAIPIALGVSVVVFSLIHLAPGDPVAAVIGEGDQKFLDEMRAQLGFDRPLPLQYLSWIGNALTGDFGVSLKSGEPVLKAVIPAALNTVTVGTAAALLGFLFGTVAGMVAGYNHGTWIDKSFSAFAIAGVSMPHYWLSILLVIVFSVELNWLPAMGIPADGNLLSLAGLSHMVLPMIALALIPAAIVARTTRACVMEILSQEFVEAQRAKGLSESRILWHVVKNASPTVLAVMGLQFAHLLGGSILVETVFSWPGTGYLMNIAIGNRDIPVLQGVLLLLAMFFVLTNLLVDILQTLIDPRFSRH